LAGQCRTVIFKLRAVDLFLFFEKGAVGVARVALKKWCSLLSVWFNF
jgi:hypothetical protein